MYKQTHKFLDELHNFQLLDKAAHHVVSYGILFLYSCSNGLHASTECVCHCCNTVPVRISCKWYSYTATCCAGSCFCGCRQWSWASHLENRGKFYVQCLKQFMCVNCVPNRREGSKAWGSHILCSARHHAVEVLVNIRIHLQCWLHSHACEDRIFMVYWLLFQRFNPVAVPTAKYGQFHVGDAYLVLNVSLGSCIVALWTAWYLISFKSLAVCYLVLCSLIMTMFYCCICSCDN